MGIEWDLTNNHGHVMGISCKYDIMIIMELYLVIICNNDSWYIYIYDMGIMGYIYVQ